jgi:hypothetical protein
LLLGGKYIPIAEHWGVLMVAETTKEKTSWTSMMSALGILVMAVAVCWAVFSGRGVVWDSPVGNTDSNPFVGSKGEPREATSKTVWQSKCPPNTRPISGTCIVLKSLSSAPPLQNIGPNEGEFRWECAWRAPVEEADVRAVCVRTK